MEKSLDGRQARSHQDREDVDGLQRRHQELERQLAVLDRHLALSAAEQAERARLKKEKLAVKDRLLLLQAAIRPH
jgi:hypothetical protein